MLCAVLGFGLLGMTQAQAQLTVTNGLQLWYAADQSAIATNSGGHVTSIFDLSGNGNTGTPGPTYYASIGFNGGVTLGPTYVANGWGLNGLPVLHFVPAPSDSYVGDSLVSANAINLTSGLSVFIVGRPETNPYHPGNGVLSSGPLPNSSLGSDTFTRPSDFAVYWYDNSGTTTFAGAYSYAQNNGVSGSPITLGVTNLYEVVASATGASQYQNTALDGSVAGSILPVNPGYIELGPSGQYQGYNESYSGDIGEVLVYNTALSPTDRAAVESYLFNKWFVPAAVIPEPSIVALLGLAGALVWRRTKTGDR